MDNSVNLHKIMPIIEQVEKVCMKILMDEQIITFKGRISLKIYNPKKPYKWRYKMWLGVLVFSYNFEIAISLNV